MMCQIDALAQSGPDPDTAIDSNNDPQTEQDRARIEASTENNFLASSGEAPPRMECACRFVQQTEPPLSWFKTFAPKVPRPTIKPKSSDDIFREFRVWVRVAHPKPPPVPKNRPLDPNDPRPSPLNLLPPAPPLIPRDPVPPPDPQVAIDKAKMCKEQIYNLDCTPPPKGFEPPGYKPWNLPDDLLAKP